MDDWNRYIAKVDLVWLAESLGCSMALVYAWRRGTRTPGPDMAPKLEAISGGVVRAEDLCRCFRGFKLTDPDAVRRELPAGPEPSGYSFSEIETEGA